MTKRNSTKPERLEIVALGKCDVRFANGIEMERRGVVLTRDARMYIPAFILPSSPFDITDADCYIEVYPIGKPYWKEWAIPENERQACIPKRRSRLGRYDM